MTPKNMRLTRLHVFGGQEVPAGSVVEIRDEYGPDCWVALCNGEAVVVRREDCEEDVPPPTLQQKQLSAWARISAHRDHLNETGGYPVTVGGAVKWFHSNPVSQTQQLALARKADKIEAAGGDMLAQFTGNSAWWKTMDGTFVAMNATLAQAIADAAELQSGAIFRAAEVHRQQMLATAEPDAYDHASGWPEVYGGTP